jgi:hypothetical protein
MAWRRGLGAGGQQAKAILKTLGDLFGRQDFDPRRGQFERERDAVEADADLGDSGGIGVGQAEVGAGCPGALDEELNSSEGRHAARLG